MSTYSDKQILFIKELVAKLGKSWGEIATQFNQAFDDNKSPNAIRKTFARFEDEEISDDTLISNLEKARKTSLENRKLKKAQNILVDNQLTLDEVLSELRIAIRENKFKPVFVPMPVIKKDVSKKPEMAIEILYSDLHCGKQSQGFNTQILEKRIKEFSHTTLKEIQRYDQLYNITTVILAILGDMIENSYFHGMESMSACEIENSEQIRLVVELTYKYLLVPLARTNKKIIVPCVTGNHDRALQSKTYIDPGKNNLSWIIYQMLKLLCEETKIKNVEFIIPEGIYCYIEIFGKTIFYEHGDCLNSYKEDVIESLIHKRSKQIGKMIDYIRLGHFHNHACYNKGRIIFNGGLCGIDSYADVKGFTGAPTQVINFYINRKKGDKFYHSFAIDLDSEE